MKKKIEVEIYGNDFSKYRQCVPLVERDLFLELDFSPNAISILAKQ